MFRLILQRDYLKKSSNPQELCEQLVKIAYVTINDTETMVQSTMFYNNENGWLEKTRTEGQLEYAVQKKNYSLIFLN